MKTALITGVTGQDGAYLSELLLAKGYKVHGIKRRSSMFNTQRIDHIYEDPHVDNQHFVLHYGDLTDATNVIRIIQDVQPDEIYNLGAQSHVQVSFETPEYTAMCGAHPFVPICISAPRTQAKAPRTGVNLAPRGAWETGIRTALYCVAGGFTGCRRYCS